MAIRINRFGLIMSKRGGQVKMSRAMIYSAICLMLMTLSPICIVNATTLPKPRGSEFSSIENRIDESTKISFTSEDTLAQVNATIDKVSHENPDSNPFKVPIPSTVLLMAGGLLALVLIRRRHK